MSAASVCANLEAYEHLESSSLGSPVSTRRRRFYAFHPHIVSSDLLPAYATTLPTRASRRAAPWRPASGMMEVVGAPLVVAVFTLLLMSRCSAQNPEVATLRAAMNSWTNGAAVLGANWSSVDNPCYWTGIICNENNRVIILTLNSMGLEGELPRLAGLTQLRELLLDRNRFYGSIPDEYGSYSRLEKLSLRNNALSGPIPPLGALVNLTQLFLENNMKINGSIPPSLGRLASLQSLFLANNSLTGEIPPDLGQLSNLQELSVWGNPLSGGLPFELGSLKKLTRLNVHDCRLRGNLHSELGNMTSLEEIWLNNNDFYGGIPEEWGNFVDLTRMRIRRNRLTGPLPVSLGNLTRLTEMDIAYNQLVGEIPTSLTNVQSLNNARFMENYFNGTPPSLPSAATTSGWEQNNCLQRSATVATGQRDNAICSNFYQNLMDGCGPCPQPGTFWLTSRPCRCRTPLEIYIAYANSALLPPFNVTSFSAAVAGSLSIDVSQVVQVNSTDDGGERVVRLWIVPMRGDALTDPEVENYILQFKRSTVKTDVPAASSFRNATGPKAWDMFPWTDWLGTEDRDNDTKDAGVKVVPIAIGVALGAVIILVAVAAYVFLLRSRKPGDPQDRKGGDATTGRSTYTGGSTGGEPGTRVAVTTARVFSREELAASCNNFAKEYEIGVGGHARVYRGHIDGLGAIAVKRAKLRAVQGREFKNELDVLSRVHHRNLVRFLGCCEEEDEQILVYEYMPNGTLYNHLAGRANEVLDWQKRLDIAIGTANGLTYLHNHADPPIIHRDIKPSNILLDDKMNAKLGDFGISRMLDDPAESAVFTRVAGTLGYLDPMYHETRSLTDKSDVFSFGVVLLELVSGKDPSGRRGPLPGMTVVEWVENEYTKGGLEAVVDPALRSRYPYDTMCRIVELGLWCTRPTWDQRPTMKEVLNALEVAKKIASKEAVAEDGPTTVEVFGRHLHQMPGGKKPEPKGTGKGARLYSEDQLLEDPYGGSPSFTIDSMPQMTANFEGR